MPGKGWRTRATSLSPRKTRCMTLTIIRRRVDPSLVPTRGATRQGGRSPAVVRSGLKASQKGRGPPPGQGARPNLQGPFTTSWTHAQTNQFVPPRSPFIPTPCAPGRAGRCAGGPRPPPTQARGRGRARFGCLSGTTGRPEVVPVDRDDRPVEACDRAPTNLSVRGTTREQR